MVGLVLFVGTSVLLMYGIYCCGFILVGYCCVLFLGWVYTFAYACGYFNVPMYWAQLYIVVLFIAGVGVVM